MNNLIRHGAVWVLCAALAGGLWGCASPGGVVMPPDGLVSDGDGALLPAEKPDAPTSGEPESDPAIDSGKDEPDPRAEAEAQREAEAQARREAAEQKAAEARAKKEAAAQAKAEAIAQREAEAQAKKEAEARARAESEAQREAEAQARREAAEQKAAEARARKEAAAKAKAEAAAQREAEAQAKKEAEAQARAEAEAKKEAEAQAKREAAEQKAAEARAKKEAAAQAKVEPNSTPDDQSDRYVLMPGDEVELLIFREPEMSGVFRLNESGELRHPVAGTIPLSEMTLHEAEEELIRYLARDYLVDPRLVLRIVSARSSQVVLLGEVMEPGVYSLPYGEGLTLLQAIAGAGGFTELASPERIRIVRRQADGTTTTLRVRMSDLTRGKGGKQDVPLQPNDVIMVDEVFF